MNLGQELSIIGTTIGIYLDNALHELCSSIIKNYNNNKYVIDNYNDVIIKKGYCLDLNEPIVLEKGGKNNEILIDSNIRYEAKATAIFGDRTKAKIYSMPAIAKTSSKVRKYAVT